MKHQLKLMITVAVVLLMVYAAAEPVAQSKPVLSGRVSIKSAAGLRPLRGAKVELLRANVGRALHQTYSDSNGNFAFYRVPRGRYNLRVVFGNNTLAQFYRGKQVKVQPVTVNASSKGPRIMVTIILK